MDEIQRKIAEFDVQLTPKSVRFTTAVDNNCFVVAFLGFIFGLAIRFYFNSPAIFCSGAIFLSILLFLAGRKNIYITLLSVFICFFSAGSLRLQLFDKPATNDIANISFDDFTFAQITAEVISEPRVITEDDWFFNCFSNNLPYTSFYAEVKKVDNQKACGKIKFYVSGELETVKQGNKFETFCRLKKFAQPQNPGQFNVASYMHQNRVAIAASVKTADAIKIIDTDKTKEHFYVLQKFRQFVSAMLLDNVQQNDTAAIISALLLGQRTNINSEIYQSFTTTGLAHFISLSGLHLGIIAALVWFIAKHCGLLKTGRCITCIIFILLFVLIIPPRTPTIRAAIMFLFLAVARIFNKKNAPLNSLAAAAIIILLIRPLDFLNAGFQLSFSAVASILLFVPALQKIYINLKNRPLRIVFDMFSVSIAAWLGVAGILAWHFYSVQLLTAIWTLPAFVLVSAIIILGIFKIALAIALPSLAALLADLLEFSAAGLIKITGWFSEVPFCQISSGRPAIWFIIGFYAILLLWRFTAAKRTFAAAMLILLTIFAINLKLKNSCMRFTVLSIGHGQAAVLNTPDGRNIIFDCGSMTKNNIGRAVVNPFLNFTAAKKIDAIFISHDDIDHYNGIAEIIEQRRCPNIYTPEKFINNMSQSPAAGHLNNFLQSRNISIQRCPEHLNFGEIKITQLWPNDANDKLLDDNEAALVLLLDFQHRKVLLCSDIPENIQSKIMRTYSKLKVDILITPHHGSRRTLNEKFLTAFEPEYIITSCSASKIKNISSAITGRKNSYLTCHSGAITAELNKETVMVKLFNP